MIESKHCGHHPDLICGCGVMPEPEPSPTHVAEYERLFAEFGRLKALEAEPEPVPHADRDASEAPTITCVHDDGSEHLASLDADGMATLPCTDAADLRERAERAESVARGQQKLIEAQRAELDEFTAKNFAPMSRINRAERVAEGAVQDKAHAEAEVERLLAENADRESERADLRDRVEKAEAAVGRVEAALDIRTRARAWMSHLGYEDHQIDKAEAWRQPLEPWLQDDPPVAVVDLETAAGFAREYEEVIRAALRGDQ